MLTPETIAAFVEFGLTASVQPAFDAAWGGEAGMYAEPARRRAGPHPEPVRGASAGQAFLWLSARTVP